MGYVKFKKEALNPIFVIAASSLAVRVESFFLELDISHFIVVLQLDFCVDQLVVGRLLVDLEYLVINLVFYVWDNSR